MEAAELAASDRDRGRDVAELLVDLALAVGPDRAVDSAVRSLGPDEVALSLRRLQPLALPAPIRRRLKANKGVLDRLRAEVEQRTGVHDIEFDRIERVSPRTLVMIGAATLAFYSLLPQLANVDDTIDAFGDARWQWVPAILAAAASTYVFATVSLLGSVADPVPVAAAARSTVASSFAALVGPATTGRMALAVRFLQRTGIDGRRLGLHRPQCGRRSDHASAVDVQLLRLDRERRRRRVLAPELQHGLVDLAIIATVIAVAMLLGPIRRRVLTPALRTLQQAQRYLGRVLRSPLRVVALLGGSSLITLSYMTALVFSIEAFGGGLSIPQIGAAYPRRRRHRQSCSDARRAAARSRRP